MGKQILLKWTLPILILLGILCCPLYSQAQTDSTHTEEIAKLFGLSLEDLLNINVSSATLVGSKRITTPASVTVITEEDIRMTPARNLNDLIEVYVPGALWMNHHEGPHLGMRGVIADRNYKYLLLVNGVNLNQKAHNGATSELENWDLNDIAKIEIIRGPGSVTYGPGAVMGVINIITKNAKEATEENSVEVQTNFVSKYNSKGFSASHAIKKDGIAFYNYASMQSTAGFTPNAYTVNSTTDYGYVGKDFTSGNYANEPIDYFQDYQMKPQVKIHSQINTDNGWEFFGRYTQSGTSANGVNPKVSYQTGYLPDSTILLSAPYNAKQLRNQHFTLLMKKKYELSEKLSATGQVVYDNENHIRNQSFGKTYALESDTNFVFNQNMYNSVSDPNHLRIKNFYFSEEEISARGILNYRPTEKLTMALGSEFVRNTWRAPWGKDEKSLRMGDGGDIISGTNSFAYGSGSYFVKDGYFVGNGWSTNTASAFGEVKYDINDRFGVLASGRADKDTYSKLLYSPRLAFIAKLNSRNAFRLIYQQSKRMNTAEQLYVQHVAGKESTPETISGIELIYTGMLTDRIILDATTFYNKLDVLGWSQKDSTTNNVGQLSLMGAEVSIEYRTDLLDVGFNHSITQMLDWKTSDQTSTSGISYSDYDQKVTYKDDNGKNQTVVLTGNGKNLNNWSNNTSKLYINIRPTEKLTIHVNGQLYYGFQGNQDGLNMLVAAFDTVSNAEKFKSELNASLDAVEDKGTYGFESRLNLSLSYKITKNINLIVYAQGLAGINNNKRYSYDAGINSASAHRVAFVEEPTVFGTKIFWKF